CSGLVKTRSNFMPWSRSLKPRALRSPSWVSGMSVRPVCLPLALHSVSPWRTRVTLGSMAAPVGIGGADPALRPAALDDFLRLHPHILPRRVRNGLELAAAGLASGDLFRGLRGEPFEPVGPPGAGRLLGGGEPGFEVAGRRPV